MGAEDLSAALVAQATEWVGGTSEWVGGASKWAWVLFRSHLNKMEIRSWKINTSVS